MTDGIDCSGPHIDRATAMDRPGTIFPTVTWHRPVVDMAEGTRGGEGLGRAPDTRLELYWQVLNGKVLIPKILGGVQIKRQLFFSPNGNLPPKANFSRDINLGQIRVQLKGGMRKWVRCNLAVSVTKIHDEIGEQNVRGGK
jgi:hypothetical protein